MPPFLRQNRDNSQKKETSVPQSVLRSSCRYARHEHCLTGESPEQALIAGIAQPKDKGVHRKVESEGSRRQTSELTNRNFIQGI